MDLSYPLSAVDLTAALIRLASPDPPGDERAMADGLAGYLGAAGFAVEVDEFAPGRFNLVARVTGVGRRPGLVFSAHMDTLPADPAAWSRDPFSGAIEGGRVLGRGACDMKSGLAAMVRAAERVFRDKARGVRLQGDLVLALSGGESSNCLGARRFAELGTLEGCGALLISEPSSLQVFSAEMGALWLRAVARGSAGHVSDANGGGRNAIDLMLRFLADVPSHLPDTTHPLLGRARAAVGRIAGGSVVNVTPDRCMAEIDIRLPPGVDPDQVQAALDRAVGPPVSVERMDYKPPVETAGDDPFLATCLEQTAAVTGEAVVPRGVAYFSDGCVLAPRFGLPMVIVGPGPVGGSGSVDEWCDTRAIERAEEIYYRIASACLT